MNLKLVFYTENITLCSNVDHIPKYLTIKYTVAGGHSRAKNCGVHGNVL